MNKHIHILRIDSVCSECNYKNKGEYVLEESMEIVCCGNCGAILSKPDEMTEDEQAKVRSCVQQALEEEDDNVIL